MKILISLFLFFGMTNVYAYSLKEQRHEHVLAYSNYIRGKVKALPKKAIVEVVLKNGNVVNGIFENYISYDDSVWVRPLIDGNIFTDEAYDINEIYDIDIKEPV